MRNIAAIAMLVLLGACVGQSERTTILNDVTNDPQQATVGPAPQSAGRVVIKAVGGRVVQCGVRPCERVRLAPGTTILRLDFIPGESRRFAPATDIDLPITVQGGHTYHLVATVVRDASRARVVVEAVDIGR